MSIIQVFISKPTMAFKYQFTEILIPMDIRFKPVLSLLLAQSTGLICLETVETQYTHAVRTKVSVVGVGQLFAGDTQQSAFQRFI